MDADLHGVDRAVEDFGNGIVVQLLIPAQDENLAFFHRQFPKGLLQEQLILLLLQLFMNRWLFRNDRILVVVRIFRIFRLMPEKIIVDVSREMVHPCRERTIAPECVTVFQDPEENLLHHVLACMAPARQPEKEIVEPSMVSLKQDAELADIAVADPVHQIDISDQARFGRLLGMVHSLMITAESEKGYTAFASFIC